MQKFIVNILVLMTLSFEMSAQTDTNFLKREISNLKIETQSLKNENNTLENKINSYNRELKSRIDSIQDQLSSNTSDIVITANKLGIKIDQTSDNATQKITALDNSISKNSLYWIIGLLLTALLFIIVYFLLHKKIKDGNSVLDKQILATKKSLEEEGIKLDTKLTEILESQLKILTAERSTESNSLKTEEIDHSLALKVADEIVRIQKNLFNMDSNTKGLKQLAASVKRIQDNFEANGYEIIELLNKPYDPKIKLIVASSIPDEDLKEGEEIITRIIKPQVNFKGVMIQSAQVEVSVGNS